MTSKWFRRFAASAAVAGMTLTPALCALPGVSQNVANAQEADRVSPTGKGIVGGALLGAELVIIIEGIAGVDKWWAYLLGGLAGGAGGAVGGYFLEDAISSSATPAAEAPLYMLAGGMALIIPTIVVALNATAYRPDIEIEEGETETEAPDPNAPSDGPKPNIEGAVEVNTGMVDRPMSLVGLDAFKDVRLTLGMPAMQLRPSFTPTEIATYGVVQNTEVHFPLIAVRF